LAIVVPLALFLIFTLLYTAFRSAKMAAIIFLNVPLAATGRREDRLQPNCGSVMLSVRTGIVKMIK